ncbi:LysR family transcriptional regulator [Niallia taxi]|uniref:LysR family transcriptional regulator n=1 Tax=Niallia taxi TaxID=2499688 RepID=UPI002E213C88|nr:LysR family transcriptional regulator [Niallia taxi]
MMEIRHFITFQKVIECGSFTLAAEHLGYTQSTVTSHIQTLEEHIGAPLFDRMGRRIRLTDIGSKLLHYSQEILQTYEKIETVASEEKEIQGELRIVAPESLTVYRLEPILSEYRKKYPLVNISLSNATCSDNKKAILNGSADIAFVIMQKIQDTELIVHSLSEEPVIVVANPDNALSFSDSSYENQKIRDCLIANEKACSYRVIFEDYLRKKGIELSNTLELWSIEAIKRCVMSGLGISCLPLMTVKDELYEGRLKIIPTDVNLESIFPQLIYHKNKWTSPALSRFIDITLKYSKEW